MMPGGPDEPLPVVDENDQVIGIKPRGQIHALGLFHRAVHIMVFDPAGRLYLQKRSANKDTHPHKWTTSASGHVDPGESYFESALRELGEELGLTLALRLVGDYPASPETENEFTRLYQAVTTSLPAPDPYEIEFGHFFTWTEAMTLAQDPAQASPSLLPMLKLYQEKKGSPG